MAFRRPLAFFRPKKSLKQPSGQNNLAAAKKMFCSSSLFKCRCISQKKNLDANNRVDFSPFHESFCTERCSQTASMTRNFTAGAFYFFARLTSKGQIVLCAQFKRLSRDISDFWLHWLILTYNSSSMTSIMSKNRGPKKFSLCLNSKGFRKKRVDGLVDLGPAHPSL